MNAPIKLLFGLIALPCSSLHAQDESSILKSIFTDPTISSDQLLFEPIKSLNELSNSFNDFFPFASESVYTGYDSLRVSDVEYVADSLAYVSLGLAEKTVTSYAYFKPSTDNSSTAIFIIPGSGQNQSSEIYWNTASNYYNIPAPISESNLDKGDVFIYIKPNEDLLAMHYNGLKLSTYSLFAHLINEGRSYSSNYLIQCIGFVKALKSRYDRVIVLGLSQGGYASLLVSLISEPTASIVSSGYSILFDDVYFADINQIVIPDLPYHFSKEKIYDIIDQKSTYYLFSWGNAESGVYGYEANHLATYQFLSPTGKVYYHSDHSEHLFPPHDVVADFIVMNNLRPLIRIDKKWDCDQLREYIVIHASGQEPINLTITYNDHTSQTYVLKSKSDTLRNLIPGVYYFSDPENNYYRSAYWNKVHIEDLQQLGDLLSDTNFTYMHSTNMWFYDLTIDETSISDVVFVTPESDKIRFSLPNEIELPSGKYDRIIIDTRGGCVYSLVSNILLLPNFVSVYPNPFTDKFFVSISLETFPFDVFSITVHDSSGKTIVDGISNNGKCLVDLSGESPGLYFVKVRDSMNRFLINSIKIMKQ